MNERSIFMEALEHETPAQRSGYLEKACGDDRALRQRVEALLASDEQAGSFLGKPIPERLAEKPAAPGRPEETCDEPSAAEDRPRPLPEGLGSRIGPYKLLQEIGEGGMGTVFMAEQSEPVRRMVALKIIKPGMDSRHVIARFEAERQALALMDHPNIARVLDAGTTESARPYFVMELVKGVPITKFCDERRLTPKQRLELFVPVCQAVQHAHQKGIIHRDLKPSNVLVCLYDGKPVPKVIDFGIAKATGQKLTERTMFTEIGQVVGTLEYMSPEQAEVNQLDIDTRSDIYSLGVLLYELLTGSTPLDRKRLNSVVMLEVLRLIREEEPPRPSTRLSELKETLRTISAQRQTEPAKLSKLVRGELDWIVMKALEKDRNLRYETANGFALDVQRYLADEPVLACPPSGWYQLRKFVRRHQAGLFTTAALLLVVLLAGVGVGWVLWDRAKQLAARTATTERTVSVALARAGQLAEQTHKMPSAISAETEAVLVVWRQAEDALAQADAALTTGTDDGALRQQVAAMKAELEKGRQQTEHGRAHALRKEKLFRDLDDARMARSVWVNDRPDYASQAAIYEAAFAAYGLDVVPERRGDLGRQIAGEEPEVRETLWVALVDWAVAASAAKTRWSKSDLLELARTADSSAWRQRMLSPHDRPALVSMSVEARQSSLPPTSLVELARCLYWTGERQEDLTLLRWARGRYPKDFWLHMELGDKLLNQRDTITAVEREEAIGCYRAALALRPEASIAHLNLGIALHAKGQPDEAIAEFRESLRLNPDFADTHTRLGQALRIKGQLDEAIAEAHAAIRLKKDFSPAHVLLGRTLHQKGQIDDAIADLSKAIECDQQNTEAWYSRGLAYSVLGQCDKAIADCTQAIALDPKCSWAWNHRGLTYAGLHQYDKAIADLSKAIEFDQQNTQAWCIRGITYALQHQYDKAVADFSKAIECDPKYAIAWHNRGDAYDKLHQFDKAVSDFSKAMECDSKHAPDWNGRGSVYMELGEREKALADFSHAIKLDPKYADAWSNRGLTENELHQYDKAVADCSQAIALDPKHSHAWNQRGLAYAGLRHYDKAVADFTKAIECDQKNTYAWFNRGKVYHTNLGQFDNAVADYSKVIELDVNHVQAWLNRGIAYYCLRQYLKAIADFSRANALDPKNKIAWALRGGAYGELRQYSKAVADFSKAIELDPKFAMAWSGRGHAYGDLSQYAEAIADFSKAIQLDPKSVDAWIYRGGAYGELRQYSKAVADFSKAIELDPKFAMAWSGRGHAYHKLGQYDNAVADYSKSIELNPKDEVAYNELAWLLATCPDTKVRDPKRAVDLANNAVQLAPKQGDKWNTLGTAHYRAGDWKAAIAALNKSMELSGGGDAGDWFFLAMAHKKLGSNDESRKRYDQAVQWLEKNKETLANDKARAEELHRFRSEAEEVLELKQK